MKGIMVLQIYEGRPALAGRKAAFFGRASGLVGRLPGWGLPGWGLPGWAAALLPGCLVGLLPGCLVAWLGLALKK